jgi:hypothetical protein
MDEQQLNKDVTIAGKRYQIGRFTARTGSWILAQVLTKMLPSVIEKALAKHAGAKLAAGRAELSEDEFESIQAHALAVCRRYEGENQLPMPIFLRPDRWAAKDLEFNLVTVMSLTIQALVFNLESFFDEDGLNQILDQIPGLASASSTSGT